MENKFIGILYSKEDSAIKYKEIPLYTEEGIVSHINYNTGKQNTLYEYPCDNIEQYIILNNSEYCTLVEFKSEEEQLEWFNNDKF